MRYRQATAYAEATQALDRVRLTGRASVADAAYRTLRARAEGVFIKGDRDSTVYDQAIKAEYAAAPDTSVFTTIRLNQRHYRNALPTEARRDSDGYDAAIGASIDLARLIRAEGAVGYLRQSYDSAAFRAVSGISYRGRLEYFISGLTTATVSVSRSVEDSGLPNIQGYVASRATARIDHELRRNLIIAAEVRYGQDAYQAYPRRDGRWRGDVTALYRLNRAVAIKLAYAHLDQKSSGLNRGADYVVNRLTAALVYRL